MLWVCLLFKSSRFLMHTSVLLLGAHNRSWYIYVCELFKIFCFSPRHFIDKYIQTPPLGSPLELFFMKYTSIWWPRLENVADGAAPSTLKEACSVSDSSPGNFLNTDEWVYTCFSSPGVVKVHRLCCHLMNIVISESSTWRRHTYFHTNSVWN